MFEDNKVYTYVLTLNPPDELRTKTKIRLSGSPEAVICVRLIIVCEKFLYLGIEIVGIIITCLHYGHLRGYKERTNDMMYHRSIFSRCVCNQNFWLPVDAEIFPRFVIPFGHVVSRTSRNPKKPLFVKYGLNHIVALIEAKEAALVVIAHDVDSSNSSSFSSPCAASSAGKVRFSSVQRAVSLNLELN